jgi:flagellar assembly factor FliW
MSDVPLRGKILGFEEYENYVMRNEFGETSPFRLLVCNSTSFSFVMVNPYRIFEDYTFELENDIMNSLKLAGDAVENIAVLCIVRPDKNVLFVNLRSPVVINIKEGLFRQIILQNESYGVSVPFAAKETQK